MSRPIRKTQAIAPFGPGAMVDFPGPVSLIHAGLDAWKFDSLNPDHREFIIDDEKRLARRLGVEYFVEPQDYRRPDKTGGHQLNLNLKIPFLRFPLWHFCPRCGRMHQGQYHHRDAPVCTGPISTGVDAGKAHPARKTFQVRFVAACAKGHIQDFPWLEWVFEGNPGDWAPNGSNRCLRMNTSGSASLGGVFIQAEQIDLNGNITIVKRRTLANAFFKEESFADGETAKTALSHIDINCSGINPVLAVGTHLRPAPGCGQPLFTALKNAANLYFPQVVSSIYIPDIEDKLLPEELLNLLDDRDLKSRLRDGALGSEEGIVTVRSAGNVLAKYYPESSVSPQALADAANSHLLHSILLEDSKTRNFMEQRIKSSSNRELSIEIVKAAVESKNWGIDPEKLLKPLKNYFSGEDIESIDLGEESYRLQEYRVFSRDQQVGYPKMDLDVRSQSINDYDSVVRDFFKRVALLHKLRETRAFDGFSRIYSTGLTSLERRGLFMSTPKKWLPAIVVRGEGIFLQFDEEKLNQWVDANHVILESRLSPLRNNLVELSSRRHLDPRPITPKFVLLHTFAHLLINQLVQDCGYGSASLRERIYSSDGGNPMAAVLIYTAAGDSEGTMGDSSEWVGLTD